MTVTAIVLGKGATAIGAMRCLARQGIDVVTATPSESLATKSRYFRPARTCDGQLFSPSWQPDDYVQLANLEFDKAVLIPCSDVTAAWAANMPESLYTRFPASNSSRQTLRLLQDKREFANLCQALEAPHPKCFPVDTNEDLRQAPIEKLRNLFFKPTSSCRFAEKYNSKAMHFKSRREAELLWRKFSSDKMKMMLQEYIPGPANSHYFIDGFRDRDGTVRARHTRRRLRMHPADFGNSSYFCQIPDDEIGPAWIMLDKILTHVGYRGIFSAEFKFDERDGEYKILEINTRAWVYVEFAAWCGLDVCNLSYLDALKQPVPNLVSNRQRAACVDLYLDYHSVYSQSKRDRQHVSSVARQWLTSRKTLFCWQDPKPAATWFFRRLMEQMTKKPLSGEQ